MLYTYIYLLPKDVKHKILKDCYARLLKRGISKADARHEVSNYIACSRLYDIAGLIDPKDYIDIS